MTAVDERDVVGIGALNIDFLVWGVPVAAADRNIERAVDEATVRAVLAAADPARRHAVLGGSAFNTIHALAYADPARTGGVPSGAVGDRPALRLGFVGVAGRSPVPGLSPAAALDALGVDHRHVFADERRLSGTCVSVVAGADRMLVTHAGANELFADRVDAGFDDLVAYLARARLVHVTSFLDDRTPPRLLALLRAVRDTGTGTAISVDPGHVWSTNPTPAVEQIVALADVLLLNEREYEALTARLPAAAAGAALLGRMTATDPVVVVKEPAGVRCHRRDGDRVITTSHRHEPLGADETADPTGAGDVFAAGLLAVLAAHGSVEDGARLGLRLARHKLRHVGSRGHDRFAALTRAFLACEAQPRTDG